MGSRPNPYELNVPDRARQTVPPPRRTKPPTARERLARAIEREAASEADRVGQWIDAAPAREAAFERSTLVRIQDDHVTQQRQAAEQKAALAQQEIDRVQREADETARVQAEADQAAQEIHAAILRETREAIRFTLRAVDATDTARRLAEERRRVETTGRVTKQASDQGVTTFEIVRPDGKKFEIRAPAGSTKEQAEAYFKFKTGG